MNGKRKRWKKKISPPKIDQNVLHVQEACAFKKPEFLNFAFMRTEKIIELIAARTGVSRNQAIHVLELFDGGATIPFVARYRKELTGSLDEVFLANIKEEAERLDEIAKRKETILKSVAEQNLLTTELQEKIEACFQLNELEDIYLPFKPKRLKRTDINITEDEYAFITKEVEDKGLSMSEVIRRALDRYIEDQIITK